MLNYLQIFQKQSNDDDSTSYTIRKKEYEVENKLEIVSTKLFQWLNENCREANQPR